MLFGLIAATRFISIDFATFIRKLEFLAKQKRGPTGPRRR